MTRFLRNLAIAAHILGLGSAVSADTQYPAKPITWIVPFSAGGGADTWTRILAERAEIHFGQPFIIQNMPGGGGVIGWQELLNRPADGLTVIHASPTPIITLLSEVQPLFQPTQIKLAGYLGAYETLLAGHANENYQNWDGLLAYAKKNPGALTVAGTNAPLISVAGIFKEAGAEVTFVPYQGTSDAVTDFLGGHVDLLAGTTTSVIGLTSSEINILLNASDQQLGDSVKDSLGGPLPPVASELGFSASANPRWVGMHPDTPDETVAKFSEMLGALLADEQVIAQISATGEEPGFAPADIAQERYGNLVTLIDNSITLLD